MNEVDDIDFLEDVVDTEMSKVYLQVMLRPPSEETVSVDSILGGLQDCPSKGI